MSTISLANLQNLVELSFTYVLALPKASRTDPAAKIYPSKSSLQAAHTTKYELIYLEASVFPDPLSPLNTIT